MGSIVVKIVMNNDIDRFYLLLGELSGLISRKDIAHHLLLDGWKSDEISHLIISLMKCSDIVTRISFKEK